MNLVQKAGPSKWAAILFLGLGLGCGGPEQEEDSAESTDSALAAVVVTQYADVTGDNILDRIQRTSLNEFVVSVASAANVYGTPKLWTTVTLGGAYKDAQQSQYVDLNNDGKKDLAFRGPDNKFWFATSTGTAFNTPGNWVTEAGGYHVDQAKYADVDGDKRMDLIFRTLDNKFMVSLSRSTSMTAPALWLTVGGTYANAQAAYADLNGDLKADLIFHKSATLDLWAFSTGALFSAPINRDPGCGTAFGCLVVTSAALPARTINAESYEPHYFAFPTPLVKDLGSIKAGEKITITGTIRSVLSSSGSLAGSDTSDYLRMNVPPGVTVSGSYFNEPRQHVCAGSFYNYYTNIYTDPFPWSTVGYIRTEWWITGCQSLGSDLWAPYTVNLQASKGTIYIRVDGTGGPFRKAATRGAFGLAAGTYAVKAGTDADSDTLLCEAGDFCASTSVAITDRALKTVALAPR